MFESHSRANVIGIFFPNQTIREGRQARGILEDMYDELNYYGIDVLMMNNNSYDTYTNSPYEDPYHRDLYYDELNTFELPSIYPDEPLYQTIRMNYNAYNTPSLIFVDRYGAVIDDDGLNTVLHLSNMYDTICVARMLSAQLIDDTYDSDY